MKLRFATLDLAKVNANVGLVELGLKAIEYRKHIKKASQIIDTYKKQIEQLQAEKEEENKLLKQLQSECLTIDGKDSNDGKVYIKG